MAHNRIFSTDKILNTLFIRYALGLPTELGGNIPINEMVTYWTSEMDAKRDSLIALDKMVLHNDRGIVRKHDKNDKNNNNSIHSVQMNVESISGSFRKLEVD